MFFEFIAIAFLVLFLIKLLSPNVFPLIGKFFRNSLTYLKQLWVVLFNGFFRAINLLISKTVMVVGIVILVALLIATAYTTYKYPNIYDIKNWFSHFKADILTIYVYSFFIGTYLWGIIDYLKDRTALSTKLKNYFSSQIKKQTQKQYVYDEETKKYIYK